MEETKIVEVLEGPLRPDGYLLVPVVGRSGTGKSHLVRWVADRTKGRDNWESRYLAKNRTSIRNVIEIVIEGLDGDAIDAAREALETAPARSESEDVLAERLLDELALITSEESMADADFTDRRTVQMADKLHRELPDILRDPVVRRRLTGEGAVIPRLVGLAMRGRSDEDGLDNDAIRVVEEDLPLAFAEIGEASKGAQKLLSQLVNPDLKSAALDLLNEALPSAVKRVFVSDQVDLIGVFRDVRKELLASGKELVLFIEDLTVLHGVEREFLDAIIESARSPGGDLCGLRVLFAVTEHHFDGLDTVRTRCDDAYWLDTAYGPDGLGQQEAMSFLGRYLNACRQDPAIVEELWANRQSDAWMPNACDACDHQVHCHETFDRSEEGYGLYPYNPVAVNRLVKSLSGERFDPREVVRELVDRFLIVAGTDLRRADFPSDELVGPFNDRSDPIDPLVQAQLKATRPADFERVVNSMRYWSEVPEGVGDATLAAFGLDPLEAPEIPPTQRSRPKKPRGPRHAGDAPEPEDEATLASRLRSPWAKIFADLRGWAGNRQDLGAPATNELKKLVHKSVRQSLDFSAMPINLDEERFNRERDLRIEGSVTVQHRGDPIIVIEQDADTAAALQGLILLDQLPDIDDAEADIYRRQAARYLEEWTDRVTARLDQSPEPAAAQAIAGLLVCAVVAGACEEATDSHDYLAALFGGTSSTPGEQRSPKWQQVATAANTTYHRLRPVVEAHFGEARGTGATRAVRADQILTVIQDFAESWRLESDDSAIDRFMRSVRPAVEAEWEVLERMAQEAVPLVDSSRSWSEQTQRVLELVDAAHRAGRLRDHDTAHGLRALAAEQDENAHRDLLRAAELTGADKPFIERLRAVASILPDTVATTGGFIALAEQAMSGIARDLDERRAGESEDETLEKVVARIPAALSRLDAAIKELEK
ncbi:MAG: hypothetical protein F4Y05_02465 [Acidimicrobiaceae bacterium]|nr:hypothetical protein [Acidimicrobiaceae bacterium]MYE08449.1 hypothetical protein [Acidimicrobiaceae bacterium]MYI36578.1 hypothetical protein [Acidimicrobiaceae bacterium]